MTFLIAAVCLWSNVYALLQEWRWKSPFLAFPLCLLAIFSLPNLYYGIAETEFTASAHQVASLWGTLFFVCYTFFRKVTRGAVRLAAPGGEENDPAALSTACKLSGLIIFAATILQMAFYRFSLQAMMASSWQSHREAADSTLLLSTYLFFAAASYTLTSLRIKGRFGLLFSLGLVLYSVLILKSRGLVVSLAMPVFVYYFAHARLTRGHLVRLSGFLAVFFLLYLGARSVRHAGSLNDFRGKTGSEVIESSPTDLGDFSLVKSFYHFFDDRFPDKFNENITLWRVATILVPSRFKPEPAQVDFSLILFEAYYVQSASRGSFHATAVADSYFNDRYLGFALYSFLYAFTFTIAEFFARRRRLLYNLLYGPYVLVSFYIGRGSITNGYYILLFCVMLHACAVVAHAILPLKIRRLLFRETFS